MERTRIEIDDARKLSWQLMGFEKVSYEQFEKDYIDIMSNMTDVDLPDGWQDECKYIYDNIKLPKRATAGSAGYDFYLPYPVDLPDTEKSIVIPTGIRCRMPYGFVLMLFPRSGLGFRCRFALDNTVGIVDSDYYNAANEGHIMAKVHVGVESSITRLPEGKAFMQGVLLPFAITSDDSATAERTGGFGSTDDGRA